MSAETVLERIEQEPITIDLENGRLRVRTLEAAPPDYSFPTDLVDALREAVESLDKPEILREFTEGVRRLNAQRHLDHLAKGRSLQGWKDLHGRITKHWPQSRHRFDAAGQPQDDPYLRSAWSNLCSWADAHLHIAAAEKDLAERTKSARVLGGKAADLSWNSRQVPVAEDGIVWHAMFDEEFFQLLIGLKG